MKALLELGLTLAQIEQLACTTALDCARHNKTKAALRLGVHRRALDRRLPLEQNTCSDKKRQLG